jgi:hypothetical protein
LRSLDERSAQASHARAAATPVQSPTARGILRQLRSSSRPRPRRPRRGRT